MICTSSTRWSRIIVVLLAPPSLCLAGTLSSEERDVAGAARIDSLPTLTQHGGNQFLEFAHVDF